MIAYQCHLFKLNLSAILTKSILQTNLNNLSGSSIKIFRTSSLLKGLLRKILTSFIEIIMAEYKKNLFYHPFRRKIEKEISYITEQFDFFFSVWVQASQGEEGREPGELWPTFWLPFWLLLAGWLPLWLLFGWLLGFVLLSLVESISLIPPQPTHLSSLKLKLTKR